MRLGRLAHLSGLEATRADADAARAAAGEDDPDPLEVREEPAGGLAVRVADVLPRDGALPADRTLGGHARMIRARCPSDKPRPRRPFSRVARRRSHPPATTGEPAPAPPAEEVDTSDWHTYRNEAFGYEIRYPADWEIVEAERLDSSLAREATVILLEGEAQKVTMREPGDGWPGEFRIEVRENLRGASLEEWARSYGVGVGDDGETEDHVQVRLDSTLDARPAVEMRVWFHDHEETSIAAEIAGRMVLLSFTASTPNDLDLLRHLSIHREILRSFRFL